jgi:hypothetical protein
MTQQGRRPSLADAVTKAADFDPSFFSQFLSGRLNEKSLAQEEPVYEHVAERGQYRDEFGTWPGNG